MHRTSSVRGIGRSSLEPSNTEGAEVGRDSLVSTFPKLNVIAGQS
jgi:hypothetical protein